MNWLKTTLATLLLLLLLLAMGGLFLLGTTPGLYRLLDAAHYWLPGFSVKKVTGDWHDLTLYHVHYQASGMEIHIDQLHLALMIGCLKQGRLCIEDVLLQGITITLDQPQNQPQKAVQSQPSIGRSWPKIPLPYPALLLRQVTLNQLNLTNHQNQSQVTLASLSGGLLWQGNRFKLYPTQVDGLSVVLPERPSAAPFTLGQVPQYLNQLESRLRTPLLTLAMLNSTARWPFEITVQALSGSDWRLKDDQEHLIQQLSLTAHTKQTQLVIEQLSTETPEARLEVSGSITLQKEYPTLIKAIAAIQSGPLQGEKIEASCQGSLLGKLNLSLTMSGTLPLQAQAAVKLSQAGVPFDLAVQSSAVQWPLATARAELPYGLQLQDLSLKASGQLSNYTFSFSTDLQGKKVPQTKINLQGQGNLHQLIVKPLQLSLLDGTAELVGRFNWNQQWHWQGYLRLAGINTQGYEPGWPMSLSGHLESSAVLAQGQWQLSVPALRLQGKIKDQALDIEGRLRAQSSDEWPVAQLVTHLCAVIGPNRFELAGQWDEQVALSALVKAPQLDSLFPGLNGAMQGQLKLKGTRHHPQIVANISADNVRWRSFKMAQLKFSTQLLRASQLQGKINLSIDQLMHNTIKIDHLTLSAAGNEKQHQLHLALQGAPLSGTSKLQGQLDAHTGHWQAQISQTCLQTLLGEWQPTRTIHIDYRQLQQQLKVSAHSWQGPGSLLSLSALSSLQGNGQVRVNIQQFDLAQLQPLLNQVNQLQGVVQGHSNVCWQRSHRFPEIQLTLNGKSIRIAHLTESQPVTIKLDQVRLNLQLNDQQALCNGMFTVVQQDQPKGGVRYTLNIIDPYQQRHLSGDVYVDQLPLAPLKLILAHNPLAQQQHSEGIFNGHLRFAGSLFQPQLFGQIALTNAQIKGLLPVDIVNGHMVLTCKGHSSRLNGLFKTAQGSLRLQGDAQWQNWAAWHSTLTLKSDRLSVIVSPTVQFDVISDVQLKATPHLISLSGQLIVPSARFNIDTLPLSAVKVSKSEVILDHQWQTVQAKHAMIPLQCDVIVLAGDDVWVNAFGLQSRIDGRLKVVQAQQELGLYGQLNLHQGRFLAYGQDLQIRKGKVLFSGPVNQGLLDIEAIRDPEKTEQNVIVGLRISGLVDEPKVVVFSEPLLPESEALAYLLHGRKQVAGSELAIASQISLSLLQSGKLVKTQGLTGLVGQVGQTFGIRDLSIDSTWVGDHSQFVISGYVWRDLQFKYGVGLSTLTLRFRLMPRLYLEMISGIERALELLYQFEF